MSNEINIGGSAYGAIANGPHARAEQRDVSITHAVTGGNDQESLLASLATLRQVVEHNAKLIPDVQRVQKDLEHLRTEAEDPDRDPPAMRDTILRVIRRVGMVGTVLAAANDLREIIESTMR